MVKNAVEFAKNIALGANERMLRETGLKDTNGDYTTEAIEIVMAHVMEENKEVLLELAAKIKKEQDKE